MELLSEGKRAMAQWIVVDFNAPREDRGFWHMVGNWQEDLWRTLREDSRAFADWDSNRIEGPFSIAVPHKRHVGGQQALLNASLEAHSLADAANVSVSASA